MVLEYPSPTAVNHMLLNGLSRPPSNANAIDNRQHSNPTDPHPSPNSTTPHPATTAATNATSTAKNPTYAWDQASRRARAATSQSPSTSIQVTLSSPTSQSPKTLRQLHPVRRRSWNLPNRGTTLQTRKAIASLLLLAACKVTSTTQRLAMGRRRR